jgi:anti-sigma regulatory factor (Ser/Thr protein kinase)/serine/threonine protein phosphatase PrpC
MNRRSIKRIRKDSDVSHAVIAASDFARSLEFSEPDSRAIGTLVSELATNIIKYATDGRVVIEEVVSGDRLGVQVTVADRGPGIANIQQALQDHFSSSGTLGLGLPGVRRMADDFEIESEVGRGTTVVVRKWRDGPAPRARRAELLQGASASDAFAERGTDRGKESFEAPSRPGRRLRVGYANRPCQGELLSGDGVLVTELGGSALIVVVDGLGHGREAHEAAKAATRLVRREPSLDLAYLMQQLDRRLQDTVGAALSLCSIDLDSGVVRYLAVGNTVLRIEGERSHRIGAMTGTVGSRLKASRVETATLAPGDVLLIHTDGISERLSVEDYPQLRYQSPEVVVEKVLSRYGKRHDDASIVAARFEGS